MDKKIIAAVQGDMPIAKRPYALLAQKLNLEEAVLLKRLKHLSEEGVMRRFGATLRHQKSGFSANAMVAWQVDEARVDKVGTRLAAFRQVSHCYRRNPTPQWPYNLYTMVHAGNKAACRQIARDMARSVGGEDYVLLFSRRELKKTSMRYFSAPQNT